MKGMPDGIEYSPPTLRSLTMVRALDPVTSRLEMGLEIQNLRQTLLYERQQFEAVFRELSEQISTLTTKVKESEVKILFLQEAREMEKQARDQQEQLQAKLSQYEAKLLFYETEYERQQNQRPVDSDTLVSKVWKVANSGKRQAQQVVTSFLDDDVKPSALLDENGEQIRKNKAKIWEAHFAKLVALKNKHGHCNVATAKKKDALLIWVTKLRRQHKNLRQGKPSTLLTRDRIQRLNDIGFTWRDNRTAKAMSFEVRLAQLAEYKARHGHCNVPRDAKNCPPGLGNFVMEQRKHYHIMINGGETKSKSFTQDRVDALEALGFQWRRRKMSKRENQHGKESTDSIGEETNHNGGSESGLRG